MESQPYTGMPPDAHSSTPPRDWLPFASALIRTPSHEDETAAGDLLVRWLETHTDATVRRDDARNVIARRGEGEPTLALVGHHDVVPPADQQLTDGAETARPVVNTTGERLYGRGSADMKGALAVLCAAFADADPPGELVFASFVGEEDGGIGAQHAIENGFAPDYAVVGEGSTGYGTPGVTDIAIAQRGRRASTIRARGTSAHAGEPDAGENAIYRASEAIEQVQSMAVGQTTIEGAGTLEASLSATEIEGGTAWNVVPERCTVTLDERTIPGVDRAPLEALESQAGITVSTEQELPPMACTDDQFARQAREAASAHQAGEPELQTKPHANDAGWLAATGSSCVVCGPAEPGEAHTADESVSLDALETCEAIYRTLATMVLEGGE